MGGRHSRRSRPLHLWKRGRGALTYSRGYPRTAQTLALHWMVALAWAANRHYHRRIQRRDDANRLWTPVAGAVIDRRWQPSKALAYRPVRRRAESRCIPDASSIVGRAADHRPDRLAHRLQSKPQPLEEHGDHLRQPRSVGHMTSAPGDDIAELTLLWHATVWHEPARPARRRSRSSRSADRPQVDVLRVSGVLPATPSRQPDPPCVTRGRPPARRGRAAHYAWSLLRLEATGAGLARPHVDKLDLRHDRLPALRMV